MALVVNYLLSVVGCCCDCWCGQKSFCNSSVYRGHRGVKGGNRTGFITPSYGDHLPLSMLCHFNSSASWDWGAAICHTENLHRLPLWPPLPMSVQHRGVHTFPGGIFMKKECSQLDLTVTCSTCQPGKIQHFPWAIYSHMSAIFSLLCALSTWNGAWF